MEIVITGTSRGVGFELMKLFAEEGRHRIFAISSSEKNLKKAKEKLDNPKSVILLPHDLSIPDNAAAIASQIKKYTDKTDILINNAGYLKKGLLGNINLDEIMKMINVNLVSPGLLIRELLPLLKQGTPGHIVNIGSRAGYQGSQKFEGMSWYGASKGAVSILTETLAAEYIHDQLYFNCLAIGSVDTKMFKDAFAEYQASMQPSELAKWIKDFAENGWKYFNGQTVPVASIFP